MSCNAILSQSGRMRIPSSSALARNEAQRQMAEVDRDVAAWLPGQDAPRAKPRPARPRRRPSAADIALLDGEPVADAGRHETAVGVDRQLVLELVAAAPGELQSTRRRSNGMIRASGLPMVSTGHMRRAAQLPRDGLRARRRAQHPVAVEHDEQRAAHALACAR